MLRILHVIETMSAHEGGPPRVVAGLAVAQHALGLRPHVLCADRGTLAEQGRFWEVHEPGFQGQWLQAGCDSRDGLLKRRAQTRAWLDANLRNYDLVHIHSLWRLVPTLAARRARRRGVPYLIAPHTAISPWALGQKWAKKRLARTLVWDGIFRHARGFHALNELEAAEIRACLRGRGPAVYVVPNGVTLAQFEEDAAARPPAALAQLTPPAGAAPYVLFLARLHTMKGPDLLLEAFAAIAGQFPHLQLVFAGPDFGLLPSLKARVQELGLAARVHFPGMVCGGERLWLLRNSACLAQPSRDEGFSLSILEGLAAGRPAVISDRCKFPEVAASGAGIIVAGAPAPIADALRTYAADPARADADGRRAHGLVERQYTWAAVARQAQRMYEAAAENGSHRGRATPVAVTPGPGE